MSLDAEEAFGIYEAEINRQRGILLGAIKRNSLEYMGIPFLSLNAEPRLQSPEDMNEEDIYRTLARMDARCIFVAEGAFSDHLYLESALAVYDQLITRARAIGEGFHFFARERRDWAEDKLRELEKSLKHALD